MANLNMRIDDNLKQDAESLFNELGLNMTTATILFYKQCLRYRGIPFELRIDPFYSESNVSRLLAAAERMDRSGGTSHDLIEAQDD